MQVNRANSAAAQLCSWHQGMPVASGPIYIDADGRSVVQSVAIHQRHVQTLCGHQAVTAVRAGAQSNQVGELRTKLIDGIVCHLSASGQQSCFTLVTGIFAQECRRHCQREVDTRSGIGGGAVVRAEQLLHCPLMHIATVRGMSNMLPVMDGLLHDEKQADSSLLCGVSAGPLGEQVFSWHIGGSAVFAIAVLELVSLAGLDVQFQDYQTSEGHPVSLRTSRMAAATWLNEQLYYGANRVDDPARTIIRELQGLGVCAAVSADYLPQFCQRPSIPRQEGPDVTSSPGGVAYPSPPLLSFPMVPCMAVPVAFSPANPQMPSDSSPDTSSPRGWR